MKQLLFTIAAVVLVGCGEANFSKDELALFNTVKSLNTNFNGKSSNTEKIKQLIEAGINVSTKEKTTGQTPLHYAAKNYHREIAELLIANGADVNEMCAQGFTPLDYLELDNKVWVSDGKNLKEEMIKLLRKHGGKLEAFKSAGN